ncbi:MAG TPA: Calx-beta domain-containing protein [Wenzhouxiangella sp.]|nr:Calx-beta domain-containing protein [Wenzhouxiangella sp.]
MRFDHSYTSTTRWRLERSIDGGTTFESLLSEHEQTAVSGYRDRTVPPGVAAEYRITPLSADGGLEGTPAHAIATLSTIPAAPSGLTLLKTATGVQLQWNAYSDRRATALRVYRDSGSGFELFSTLGTDAEDQLDSGIGDAPVQYYMTATSDQAESVPTTTRGLLAHRTADEAASIRMADAELWVREGSGLARIKVIRSGNLSESALVHYTSDGPTGGTAVPGEDYIPVSGTLWFAPGQTEAEIPVELLPDAEYKWPIDQMFYVWLYINDDVFGPSTLVPDEKSTSVWIDESDVIFFPDHDLGTTAYRSDGMADIVIQRAYPSERDISVAVVVDPDDSGDSVPGVDWVDTRPWSVSFEPGQPTAVLTLDLLDGGGGDRVLNLKLEDPQGGASLNEPSATLELTILDNAPSPRASVEVSTMAQRPAGGFAAGEMGCVDTTYVNRGAVPTTGSVEVEFMPPLGFGFPEGSTLDELIVSDPEMDCFYWSDPESDPTVTCMGSTSLSTGQSGTLSVAFEAGSRGHEEVPFHVSVGDFSRPPPDLAVCAAEENRPGCGTTWIPVLHTIFVDDFESRGAACLQEIRQ